MLRIKSAWPDFRYAPAIRSSGEYGAREYTPGRSTISALIFPNAHQPVLRSTVTPGQLPTVWLLPVNRLNTVVFPQLGFPASAIRNRLPSF